tara:strand:- start:104 stop:337 length:234 start_codon:yes stop_codon:yes gene_type:complete
MTAQSNTNDPSMLVSRSVFLTAKEMIAAGLSKEWVTEELAAMYSGYELSQDWFTAVIDSATEVLNFTKMCNTHSGSV